MPPISHRVQQLPGAVEIAARSIAVVLGFALSLGPAVQAEAQSCGDASSLRNLYAGELHIHTSFSFDSVLFGNVVGPRDAYQFAQGAPVFLPPFDLGRTVQLRRPLDFVAVTDHSEYFGEFDICANLIPGFEAAYNSPDCTAPRELGLEGQDSSTINSGNGLAVFLPFAFPLLDEAPTRNPVICAADGSDCETRTSALWQETQAAAAEFNDPCNFTTFNGYEWTANTRTVTATLGSNLHRNVIFRGDAVPALPTSYFEEPTIQGLHAALDADCRQGTPGCEVMTIPHNSNLSSGEMFSPNRLDGTPLSVADAELRASIEPLVEIFQHKGSSECKPGVGMLASDELCSFESYDRVGILDQPNPAANFPPLSFVRNGLKEGLRLEETSELGVNPFRVGIIAATDAHNADSGATREDEYGVSGHQGANDWSAERILNIQNGTGIESNPGGLAFVWAEENTRGAIFDALERREVYGTSGTRPTVRFFAGRFSKKLCEAPDLVEQGYALGAPMGAVIGAVRGGGSPRFVVQANQDLGPAGSPGTPLQRIQIVKGWVDASGTVHETVVDVAGSVDNGSTFDKDTCQSTGTSSASLCAVWQDPDFDASERSFYYARVLENPTCRWSAQLCNSLAIDCSDPGSVPSEFANCCDANVPRTIQERAWTSPIFYRPESIRKLGGKIKFGDPGQSEDVLALKAKIERVPAGVDPAAQGLTVVVKDDDEIFRADIPIGTMTDEGGGRFRFVDKTGTIVPGLRKAIFKVNPKGKGTLAIATVKMDLSAAETDEHSVDFELTIGGYEAQHSRRWLLNSKGNLLKPKS